MNNFNVIEQWIRQQFDIATRFSSNSHFEINGIYMYAKVQYHLINGQYIRLISIDSLNLKESECGKGTFTKFIGELENLAKEIRCPVYVNSVINDRLAAFLERRGYQRESDWALSSWYLITSENKHDK